MFEVDGTVSIGTGTTAIITTQDSGASTTNLTVATNFWVGTLNGLANFTNGLVSALSTFLDKLTAITGITTFHKGSLMTATTTDPTAGLVELTVGTNGQQLTASSTTSTGLAWESSTKGMYSYPAFTYATSTSWTSSTTIPLGTAFVAETWSGAQCFTDIGTLNVIFGDFSASTTIFNASTTANTIGISKSFSAGSKRYVTIGTPDSSPTKISCTIRKQLSSDF